MLLVAACMVAGEAGAQTGGDYGSAVSFVKRNCPTDATVACDGRGAGQTVQQRAAVGGAGQQVSGNFAATGTGIGSTAYGAATFGGFGLPTIKSSVNTVGSVRIGNLVVAYQSYTYTGATELEDLRLSAALHIVDSSTDSGDGTRPGGAIAAAGFAIWDKDDFFTYADSYFTGTGDFSAATSLTNQGYLFGTFQCQDFQDNYDPSDLPRGPRATNYGQRALSGGETSLNVAQQNCGEDTLTLYQGDQFVIASFTQLIANRNGFVDATGTFTLGLDPSMDPADAQAFREGATYASSSPVPEPATWAIMIAGFGATGGVLRRRRRTAPAIA